MTLRPIYASCYGYVMETNKYRTNADGSAVCPHRDLTVCADCATHPHIVEVFGAHYHLTDADDRAELLAAIA